MPSCQILISPAIHEPQTHTPNLL
uniref:Uncharacterized protein n=1 Tax=Arundo donax TaxID=35708 RepID=A0A0A9HYY8_ARUDO